MLNEKAQAAFDKLYDEVYCHWLDCEVSRDDFELAFEAGVKGYEDWVDFMPGERFEYEDPDYMDIVFGDGGDWLQAERSGRSEQWLRDATSFD